MKQPFYPLVDSAFIIQKILESGKVDESTETKVGGTTTYVLIGNKPIHKSTIIIREIDGEVNFNQATSFALLFGFMGDLLEWYKVHKKWKEGGYTIK